MANESNLGNFADLTASERRELASKAGKASGKVRAEKAKLRTALTTLLDADIKDLSEADKERLKALGLDLNNRGKIIQALFEKAFKGNVKDIQALFEMAGEYTPRQEMEVDGKLEIEESPRNEITSRINSIASRAAEETYT